MLTDEIQSGTHNTFTLEAFTDAGAAIDPPNRLICETKESE